MRSSAASDVYKRQPALLPPGGQRRLSDQLLAQGTIRPAQGKDGSDLSGHCRRSRRRSHLPGSRHGGRAPIRTVSTVLPPRLTITGKDFELQHDANWRNESEKEDEMILDKPLLGKVYEGQTYLTSGMLHEDDGRILLELHNAGAGPKDDYLDQFDPSCISQQGNGVIAIGSPRMKPCPETISFFTGPQESSYLLTDCRLVDTNFAFGGGPYNSRQVIEVGRLIQLSDGGLNRFGNKYLKINRMQSTIPMLNMWLGDSALFFWLPNDDNAKQRTVVAYGLKKTKPIKIGRISNENTVYAHIQVQAGSSEI